MGIFYCKENLATSLCIMQAEKNVNKQNSVMTEMRMCDLVERGSEPLTFSNVPKKTT